MQLRQIFTVAAFVLLVPHVATAGLIYDSTIGVTAQGFGNVPRDLTIQATGQNRTGTESGCVSVAAGAFAGGPSSCIFDVLVHDGNLVSNIGGDEVSPLADNQKFGIPTLGSLGIVDPSEIQILFNATEPSGDSANVVDLTLKFYGTDSLLAAINGSHYFATTEPGNGKAGFVFVVDLPEQQWLADNIFNLPNFGDIFLALEATVSETDGGPESFVIMKGTSTVTQVPEPNSMALFGAGLLGLLLYRRSRPA